jgi:hypothetical protein
MNDTKSLNPQDSLEVASGDAQHDTDPCPERYQVVDPQPKWFIS